MESGFHRAGEHLLASAERWAPDEAAAWGPWREALSPEQRSEALLPLQASLSGLVAFRHLENHPLSAEIDDFRPHLHAVHSSYRWALDLVATLRFGTPERLVQGAAAEEPEASLVELERSLTDAIRVSERLLDLPDVDAGAFQASCDLVLRDLDRNRFFRPPDPLEFANVSELVRAESLTPTLQTWKSEAAKMTTSIAFLTLVRGHRFLGIADRQIEQDDGAYRAHVVVAAVRRELRTLTRFLLVQGVETLADELEARLLALDAHLITGAREQITETSRSLKELRESVEALAIGIHEKARTLLDVPLPDPETEGSVAVAGERLRNGIREVRVEVKRAARELRAITRPGPSGIEVERLEGRLHQDAWAFRFILRAFVAKAAVCSVGAETWGTVGDTSFAKEFVRHFRVFGPKLVRATAYPRRGPLTRAVRDLEGPLEGRTLDLAVRECAAFAEHLDIAVEELDRSRASELAFDKQQAAAELRSYLSASQERRSSIPVASGAFGRRTGSSSG